MSAVQLYYVMFSPLARTVTPTPFQGNDFSHTRLGGHFVIRTTAIGAAPSVVPAIEGLDPLSGVWYTILTGAAIVAAGTTVLRVYPSFTPVANLTAGDLLPPTWRLTMTHGNSDTITYSASAQLRN